MLAMERWREWVHLKPKNSAKRHNRAPIELADGPKLLTGLQKLAALNSAEQTDGISVTSSLESRPHVDAPAQVLSSKLKLVSSSRQSTRTTSSPPASKAESVPAQAVVQDAQTTIHEPVAVPKVVAAPLNPILAALLADLPMRYRDGLYIARHIEVPDCAKKKDFFDPDPEVGIRRRLMTIIKFPDDDTRLGNHADYVMGGRTSQEAEWKPLIAIFCANQHQKETIEKRLKRLPTIMKGYEYVVETEETQLASRDLETNFSNVQKDGRAVWAQLSTKTLSMCGLKCVVGGRAYKSSIQVTLGGLLFIDQKTYGLTTAHSLSKGESDESSAAMYPRRSDVDSNDGTNSVRQNTTEIWENRAGDLLTKIGAIETSEFASHHDSVHGGPSWDWALIRLKDNIFSSRPNMIKSPYCNSTRSTDFSSIDGYLREDSLHFGEVWVVASPGSSISGVLIEQTVILTFGDLEFEAYPIKLASSLDDGASGSWVVRNGKVCGYIFSRVNGRPWAYMLPIEPVLLRIARYYSAKSITVANGGDPGATDISAVHHLPVEEREVSEFRMNLPLTNAQGDGLMVDSLEPALDIRGACLDASIAPVPTLPDGPPEKKSLKAASEKTKEPRYTKPGLLQGEISPDMPILAIGKAEVHWSEPESSSATKQTIKSRIDNKHVPADSKLLTFLEVCRSFDTLLEEFRTARPCRSNILYGRLSAQRRIYDSIFVEKVLFYDCLYQITDTVLPRSGLRAPENIYQLHNLQSIWQSPHFEEDLLACLHHLFGPIHNCCKTILRELRLVIDKIEKRKRDIVLYIPVVYTLVVGLKELYKEPRKIEEVVSIVKIYMRELKRLTEVNTHVQPIAAEDFEESSITFTVQ